MLSDLTHFIVWRSGTTLGPAPQTDLSTSPLAPQSSKSVKIIPNPDNIPPILPTTAQLLPNKQPRGRVEDIGLSDDDAAQPKSRVTKLKRRVIATSEDDDSDDDRAQTQLRQKSCTTATAIERNDVLNPEALFKAIKDATPHLERASDIVYIKECTPAFEPSLALSRSPDKKPLSKPKKRKSQEMEEEEYSLPEKTQNTKYDKLDHPPSKCSPAPALPYPPKKYGKQGKGLFPPHLADTSPIVDFDAIPPSDLPKSRAIIMKGKNGRSVQNAKRPPARKQVANDPQKVRSRRSLDPDITLVNVNETVPKSVSIKVAIERFLYTEVNTTDRYTSYERKGRLGNKTAICKSC